MHFSKKLWSPIILDSFSQRKRKKRNKKTRKNKDNEEYDSEEEITLKVKDIRNLLKDQDTEIDSLKTKIDNAKDQYKNLVEENVNTTKRYQDEKEKAKDYYGYAN